MVGMVDDRAPHVVTAPAGLGLIAALLLGGACSPKPPPPSWQDHAVLTWAEKLSDPDSWVRAGAAEALGRMGPDAADATSLLLNRLREDEAVEVRARCARALGSIGALEAKPLLLELLRGDENDPVRAGAAEALVALGAGDELLTLLLTALDAEPATAGLQSIADGFGAVGAPCVEPLRKRLSPAAPDETRVAVALCLGAVGEPAQPAVPELVTLLEVSADRLRLAAVIALGSIGGDEACRALEATMKGDPSPSIQLEALIAAAQFCDLAPAPGADPGTNAD